MIQPPALDRKTFLRFHERSGIDVHGNGQDRMRHGFLNMPEYLFHSTIMRGEIRTPLDPADLAVAQKVREMQVTTTAGDGSFDTHVREMASRIDGIVVLQAGRIAYEAYPKMRPLARHSFQSISKVVVGLLIAILQDRGILDVEDPVDRYLADFAGAGWQGVSIRDILDHASGIAALEQSSGANSDPTNPYYAYEYRSGWATHDALDRGPLREYVASLRRHIEPGTRVEYTSVNTFVLGLLAECLFDEPLHEIISREIWIPAGAESDALLVVTPSGEPVADGGISAIARDLARFGLMFAPTHRAASDRPVVSDALLRAITDGGREDIFRAGYGRRFQEDPDKPRFLSWHWDRVWPDGDFYKGGWGGQGLFISQRADLVVGFFGSADPVLGRNEMPRLCRQIASLF